MRMQKHIIIILGLFIAGATGAVTNPKRPWTFLVYMAADNTLNEDADPNIAQMVKASATTNANILVYLNIKRTGETKKTQRLVIQNGKITQEGATTVEDSGDENTLIKALVWAVTEYPSDHLVVDLWNHGSGPLNRNMLEMLAHRGVCYDDTTGNYLSDLKYKHAFDVVVNQYMHGKKIDIIAFDACLMADLEVAFTLAPYANYMVASQQTIPGPGYNYTAVLAPFVKGNPDPVAFAHNMVTAYDAYYKTSGETYTLSATNLNKLNPLVAATNSIAQLLSTGLAADNTGALQAVIAQSIDPSNCPNFDEPTYFDLYVFYANLYARVGKSGLDASTQTTLKNALRSGLSAIAGCIFANAHSSGFARVHGMSIYFADPSVGVEPSYNDLYWTTSNPAWNNFLNDYVNAAAAN